MNPNIYTQGPSVDQNGVSSGGFAQNLAQNAANSSTMPSHTNMQAAPADPGNWFSHLLPTIGGIAAPVIGGLLAPATGGLSLLAGAALSGLGGAAGKAAENVVENKDPLDNVIGEGLTNAIGGGVGGLLGKFGTGLAKNTIAPMAGKAADSLISGQAAKGQLTTDAANALRSQYGITNLNQAQQIANHITGTNGIINQGTLRTVQGGADNGAVADMTNLSNIGKNLVAENQMQLNPTSVTQIGNKIQQALINSVNPEDVNQITGKSGNVVTSFANGALAHALPENTLQVSKNFSQLANAAYNAGFDKAGNVINADQVAKYNIFKGLADHAQEQTFANAPITAANKAQIISELQPLQAVNPQAHQALTQQVQDAQLGSDLRSMQAPFVNASKAVNATENLASKNGGSNITDLLPMGGGAAGFGIGGLPGGIAGYAAGKALESQPAQVAGASILNKLSNVAGSNTAQKMIPLLSRIGATTAANIPTMGSGPAGSQGLPQLGGTMQNGTPIPGMGGVTANPSAPSTTPYDQLVQAMMAQSILAPSLAGQSGASSFLSSIAPKLQAKQTLQSMIGGLNPAFANAGGAQGPLGGIANQLQSFIPGTAANAYNTQKDTIAAQLANSMGISKDEAINLLPSLLQGTTEAGNRISNVNSILGSLAG